MELDTQRQVHRRRQGILGGWYGFNQYGDPFYEDDSGCTYSGEEACASALTDNTFVLDSQTYTIQRLTVETRSLRTAGGPYENKAGGVTGWYDVARTDYYILLEVTPRIPGNVREGLSWQLGSVEVPFDIAPTIDWGEPNSYSLFQWETPTRLSWNRGDSISIKMLDHAVKPTWPKRTTAKRGNAGAVLNWQTPVGDGQSGITRYEYRYRTTGDYPSTWTRVPDGDDEGTSVADERSVTVTGLTNGVKHTFQVRAVNSVDNGPAWHATATPNGPPTATDRTITIPEEAPYLFTLDDWGYGDVDGDALDRVILVSVPPESAGHIILLREPRQGEHAHFRRPFVPDPDGGFLWRPRPNWNGHAYVRYKVSDGKDHSSTATITIDVTPVNDPATGRAIISGNIQSGQTLTASTVDLFDVDGLPDSLNYQWLRTDADGTSNTVEISGVTESTHTLTAEDVGQANPGPDRLH